MTREELIEKSKGFILNTDVVRAILDGRKTTLRIPIKLQPKMRLTYTFAGSHKKYIGKWCYPDKEAYQWWGEEYRWPETMKPSDTTRLWTPPCRGDDILYIRESFQTIYEAEYFQDQDKGLDIRDVILNFDDISKTCVGQSREWSCQSTPSRNKYYVYKTDAENIRYSQDGYSLRWKPPMHMPKEASRIFLEVKEVNVERLHEVSKEEIMQEFDGRFFVDDSVGEEENAKMQYIRSWNNHVKYTQIHKYGWSANPFVWVIRFNVIDPEKV